MPRDDLTTLPMVDEAMAAKLKAAGFRDIDGVAVSTPKALMVAGFDETTANELHAAAAAHREKHHVKPTLSEKDEPGMVKSTMSTVTSAAKKRGTYMAKGKIRQAWLKIRPF